MPVFRRAKATGMEFADIDEDIGKVANFMG
jgi:hypothetical protein